MRTKLVSESLNEYGEMKGFAAAQNRYEAREDPRFSQEEEEVYYELDYYEIEDADDDGEPIVGIYYNQEDIPRAHSGWKADGGFRVDAIIDYLKGRIPDKLLQRATIDAARIRKKMETEMPELSNYPSLDKLVNEYAEIIAQDGESAIESNSVYHSIHEPTESYEPDGAPD